MLVVMLDVVVVVRVLLVPDVVVTVEIVVVVADGRVVVVEAGTASAGVHSNALLYRPSTIVPNRSLT